MRLLRRLEFPYRAPSQPRGVEPAPSEPAVGAYYETDWARRYPSRLVRFALVEGVARPAAALVARPDRQGIDRLTGIDGPVVFAANHHSHVDTPLLLTSIPEPWRHRLVVGAAADYFFSTRITAAVSALTIGAIPIDRRTVGRRSADLAASLVTEGWSLLLYPEGGRSRDGWGQPFRGGAGYLAIRCGVPIVPVHLAGTGSILRKGRRRLRISRTTVTFGNPIVAGPDESARRFAPRIEQAVAELADEVATDWWQAKRRAHAGSTPGLAGPSAGSWRRAWALGDPSPRSRRERRRWP